MIFLIAIKVKFAKKKILTKLKKYFEINSPLTSIEAEFAKCARIAVMIVK